MWKTYTKTQLNRMKAADLAQHASRDLHYSHERCYAFEGGPLPRQMLMRNILDHSAYRSR